MMFDETLLTQRRSEQGLAAYDTNVRTSLGSQLLPRMSHIMSSAFISESLANQRHKPRQRSLVSKNMIGISQLNSRMTPSLSVAQTHQNSSPYTLKKPLLTKQISTTRAQILRNSSQTILDSASRFMAPPNIVTSRQSNYRQQSSRGQTLNNSIDYSQNTGSRLMHDQRDMFIRTMDQQNMRLISHIQMVEREIGEYRANVGRYYSMSDPSNNQLIVEERQEELNELEQKTNEVLEVRRELKRGIRKAKMLLEKQESRENVGDIKN
ncbi:hypothetical protein FGO68_gene9366 [Halteria grandinella]|uniref:Uncharacterized protein n=1 Tax=Halteria grandinella TaxID=5974 RepID=A0A8J8NC40_HALGN|nr:hypothetical protein FGO68_gene9366 [Halteria grandinella]